MTLNIEVKARCLQVGDVLRNNDFITKGHPVTAIFITMDLKQIHVQANGNWVVFLPETKIPVSREVDVYVP